MARPSKKSKAAWIQDYWRPMAAIVYLVICICDFIIFPWVFGLKAPSPAEMAAAIQGLDPSVASVIAAPRPQWQPLTLMGSGLFHIAMGAIVGVSAWTRGSAHIERIRQNVTDYTSPPEPQYQPPVYQPYQAPVPSHHMPPVQPYPAQPAPSGGPGNELLLDQPVDSPDGR